MDWRQAVKDLYELHLTRIGMAYHSIYHGTYVDQCVALNAVVKAQTGRDYCDFSRKEIQDVLFEAAVLLKGDPR